MNLHKYTHRFSLLIATLVFVLTIAFGASSTAQAGWIFNDQEESERSSQEAYEMYKTAQKSLRDEQYKKAAQQFGKVYGQYEASKYAADALYWRAFALYRLGGKKALRDARKSLEIQRDEYDTADTKADAEALYYRVLGKLAELGDSRAAEEVTKHVDDEFDDYDEEDPDHDIDHDYDLEEKMAALHALITMKSERAVPILKKILKDRGRGKAKLREQALFLLSQHSGEESVELLIEIAREDPDVEVRKNAVFWLSQVRSDKSAAFLEALLRESDDPELQEQAIFAISQQGGSRSGKILRDVALDKNMSNGVRENAIFWIGQNGGSKQVEFLVQLYEEVNEDNLKEKIIFSVSQNAGSESAKWLMGIVRDDDESIDTRKNALFWAAQQKRLDLDELVKLYKSLPGTELREQVVFAFSQRNEKRALDIMMDLARDEKNLELRKQLIFWIGQSNDPRVEDFLLDIIND